MTLIDKLRDTDAIFEGGIGVDFQLYELVRKLGYNGKYIGINLNEVGNAHIGNRDEGIDYYVGDCLDENFMRQLMNTYKPNNPTFLTHCALISHIFRDSTPNRISDSVDVLTRLPYRKQLHIHPFEINPIMHLVAPAIRLLAYDSDSTIKVRLRSKDMKRLHVNDGIYYVYNVPDPNPEYTRIKIFIEKSQEHGWKASLYLTNLLMLTR